MSIPLVTFCVISYNQEKYIADAVEGAFLQDYPNLEIIISDDCSQDRTWDIILEITKKQNRSHTLTLNRNEHNLGLIGNFNKAITLAKGEYLVMLAGDDISLPNRVSLSVNKIMELGVGSLALNFQYINAGGERLNQYGYIGEEAELTYSLEDYINRKPLFPSGPSRIMSRRIFDVFGMLREECPTEDTTLTFRSILLSGVAMINKVGVLYRWHGENISSYESLMNRISPVEIYRQYKADLEVAYGKNLITRSDYLRVKRVILDYKHVQVFERRLYHTQSRFKKHILGLLFVMNPFVFNTHKSQQWLRNVCPELFTVKDIISNIFEK